MLNKIRYKIYLILQSEDKTLTGKLYDVFMIICIFLSLVPLTIKEDLDIFYKLDIVIVSIFIVDYILRWMTADYYFKDKSIKSFIKYPFTPLAICDLLSILPSLTFINDAFKLFRITRFIRVFRVFRAVRLVRYSKNLRILVKVFKKSKDKLILITILALAYVFISALVLFNVEPETFNTFFDAIYWATVSLTTVGYGDIYPTTEIGRFLAMVSSFVGIAVIALPASILTSEYITLVSENINRKKKKDENEK